MAVYEEVSKETQQLFDDVLNSTTINDQMVDFKVLHSDSLKDVIYEVKKQTDLQIFLSEGINIVVIINETLFDQLEDDQKVIIIEEALNGILVNNENGKITIEKYDFNTYTGILQKHGIETMVRLKETIKSLVDEKKAKEAETKALAKPKSGFPKKVKY